MLKGVQWGHGRTWKMAYGSLVKESIVAFPGGAESKGC